MLTPESKKALEELSKTNYGRALRDYLEEALEEIESVANCTSWEDTLGRKHTVKTLKKLFYFMDFESGKSKRDPHQYS